MRYSGAPIPECPKTLSAAELVMIEETRQALAGGIELKLTPCEYNLLKMLLSHPDRIFSRNELINAVQGMISKVMTERSTPT